MTEPPKENAPSRPVLKPGQEEILDSLAEHYGAPGPVEGIPLLDTAIFLILREGGDSRGALESLQRIREETVNWNEVRVSSLSEMVDWCAPSGGENLLERCKKVLNFLGKLYKKTNLLDMERLREMDHEDRVKFLADLEDLTPWMVHYVSLAAEDYPPFLFQNDMNRVLQRLGLLEREGSPRKAALAGVRLMDHHPRRVPWQCALVRHGCEVCVSAIRVSLCRECLFGKTCPSSKA